MSGPDPVSDGDGLPTGILPEELIARLDGLTLLRQIVDGELPPPPISRVLDFNLVEVDDGRAVFRGMPNADFRNPLGTVHGGWASTLLDSALGCAVHTTLAAGETYATVEFKVSLTRPISPQTGEVVCEGVIVHRGSRIATSSATLKDTRGKLLAHGTETCLIFPLKPDG